MRRACNGHASSRASVISVFTLSTPLRRPCCTCPAPPERLEFRLHKRLISASGPLELDIELNLERGESLALLGPSARMSPVRNRGGQAAQGRIGAREKRSGKRRRSVVRGGRAVARWPERGCRQPVRLVGQVEGKPKPWGRNGGAPDDQPTSPSPTPMRGRGKKPHARRYPGQLDNVRARAAEL